MSDSDQNERDRLPWWLKPLAGGRDAAKQEVEPEKQDIEAGASDAPKSEGRSAPEGDVEPALKVGDRATGDETEVPREADGEADGEADSASADQSSADGAEARPAGRGRSRRRRGSRGSASSEASDAGSVESEEVESAGSDAGGDDVGSDAADEDAGEAASAKDDSGEETGDNDSTASTERSRSRRRGKRGGKKKNGNSGRKRSESLSLDDASAEHEEPKSVIELLPVPERALSVNDERKLGVFCDFENIALGVRDSEIKRFDIEIVLERLLEKGKIIVKKAYADWERYSDYKRKFHESAIELIDIPQKYYSGKNSADIKMVVDAMEISYTKDHLDTFVVMSGDSDFSPLVSKLKENNKNVIGVGVKNSSSNLLVDNCDEFIYYEDIWRDLKKGGPAVKSGSKNLKSTEAFNLLVASMKALMRDNKDVLWGSMIKQTMQRKKPSFNEGYYGYSTFSELLEDAERQKLVKLKKDQRSGTYIVTGFAGER